MKIGIDVRLIGKNQTGSEVFIFNLVKNIALVDAGNEYLLFTDNQNKEDLVEIGKQLGIDGKENFKIISLPAKNKFDWNFWTLPIYLRKNPVDVYHTQYITPWFVSRSIKIVTVVHDISFNFFPQFIKFSDLFFLKTLIPLSIARADKVVGVSQFTRDEIIKYYKIDPLKVDFIYNAVNEDFANEAFPDQQLEEVRKKYNLPKKFVLYMGTLQPRKNIPRLIEAFACIKDKIGDTELVVCGNRSAHNYDHRIDQVLEKLPAALSVIFPGFVEEKDKAAVFQLAHVFAFPTLYEGFGIPLLEAMSRNVPIICTDIPSLKEIAQSCALYFDSESLDDFSQKLYSICVDNDLRRELIRSGSARVSFFSWKKTAAKMLSIYKDCNK